jgi:hypothetical protein
MADPNQPGSIYGPRTTTPPPPVRSTDVVVQILRVGAVLGLVVGVGLGFALGIHYPPTVAFAVVEGVFLFGIPIFVISILVALVAAGIQRVAARRAGR